MDQYNIHVNLVMEFLKTNGYSASVISAHRICYKELRRYLASTHTSYTLSESILGMVGKQPKCLDLQDVYEQKALYLSAGRCLHIWYCFARSSWPTCISLYDAYSRTARRT